MVPFLSLFLIEEHCFPLKKGHFLSIFQCLPSVFGLPLFHFSFLCHSLFLFFLPSFLSFFFAFFWFLVLSLSFFWFLPGFCFMKRTTSKYSITKFLVRQSFLIFVGFLSAFFFQVPFPYLCFFLILSCVFCSTSMFFLKNASSKNANLWSRGGLQHNGFVLTTCVLQSVKGIVFLFGIFQFFLIFKKKNTIK